MNDFIRRRLARQPRSLALQLLIALGAIGICLGVRLLLAPILDPGRLPYITFFPGLMLTAMAAGGRAGVAFLALSPLVVTLWIVPPFGGIDLSATVVTGVAAFLIAGAIILWLCHLLTSTVRDLDAAHAQERLLVLELHHRVKNMLAVVQSLAAQTLLSTGGGPAFKSAFTERLVALGRAQNILHGAEGGTISLATLVDQTVAPFLGDEPHRLNVRGDDVRLRPDVVVDLALCLHELATNATKHGALAGAEGRIGVRWARLGGSRLELTWQEHGGPRVAQPQRRGFGARLLERGLSRKASPEVQSQYRPDGLTWTLRFDGAER